MIYRSKGRDSTAALLCQPLLSSLLYWLNLTRSPTGPFFQIFFLTPLQSKQNAFLRLELLNLSHSQRESPQGWRAGPQLDGQLRGDIRASRTAPAQQDSPNPAGQPQQDSPSRAAPAGQPQHWHWRMGWSLPMGSARAGTRDPGSRDAEWNRKNLRQDCRKEGSVWCTGQGDTV